MPIQETGIGKNYDKKMRIDSITIFRFIAALIVINFHFGKTLLDWPRILIAGSEMVTFFFVLSGFVMSYSYLPKRNIIPTEFWISRLKRLSPAYYVALILSAVLLAQDNDILSFALSALYLQSWIPPHAPRLNGPAWSVSVEIFFYLMFPVIVWGIRHRRLSAFQVCISACAFWLVSEIMLLGLLNSRLDVAPPSIYYYLIYFFPLSYFSSFCLGVAGGMWFLFYSKRDKWYFSLLAMLLALIISYLINNQIQIQSFLGLRRVDANILSPLFLLFILFLGQGAKSINNWLGARPFKLLGEASYAMYIFQVPVWFICVRLLPALAEIHAWFMLFYLVILIGFSLLFSRYVDSYICGTGTRKVPFTRYRETS